MIEFYISINDRKQTKKLLVVNEPLNSYITVLTKESSIDQSRLTPFLFKCRTHYET